MLIKKNSGLALYSAVCHYSGESMRHQERLSGSTRLLTTVCEAKCLCPDTPVEAAGPGSKAHTPYNSDETSYHNYKPT